MEDYEALSYTWGDPNYKVTIYLDTIPFQVTSNLATALRYLRQCQTPRKVWVDAICINQNDVAERNTQIGYMASIYALATQVLVWLGGPDSEVEDMLTILKAMESDNRSKPGIFCSLARSLSKMLKKPWWHRTWVIQEVVLATRNPMIGCGQMWLEWDKITRVLVHFSSSMLNEDQGWIREIGGAWDADPFLINRFALLRDQWREVSSAGRGNLTIAEIIERTRGHEATDKKDQIFAILGLICDVDRALLPMPDYDVSVSEVYQHAMLAIFKPSGTLDFLIHAPEGRQSDLPSWCADFSKKSWDWESSSGIDDYNSDQVGNDLLSDAYVHDSRAGTLRAIGRVIGEVVMSDVLGTGYSGQAPRVLNFDKFVHQILDFTYAACEGFKLRYGKEEASKRIAAGEVWETICKCYPIRFLSRQACARVGIRIEEEEDMPSTYAALEEFVREAYPLYKEALQEFGLYYPASELPERKGLCRVLSHTLVLLMQESNGCSWLVTKNGYAARAERKVQQGDLLCMISRCRLPLLLRPRGQDSFELISVVRSTDFQKVDVQESVKGLERRGLILQ